MEDMKPATWDAEAQRGLEDFVKCGDARGKEFLANHPFEANVAAAKMALRAEVATQKGLSTEAPQA